MAYTKGTWTDEVLSGSERYNIKTDGGSAIETNVQIELATTVAVAGTSVDASKMNNIETGVENVDGRVTTLESGTTTIAGVKTFSSFPVTPSSAPTTDYQVANKKYVLDNAGGGIPVARVMSLTNVTLSTGLENGDTLNGITLATGDTVLLAGQTASAENGLYTVVASGTASRHSSYATWNSMIGLMVSVADGTVGADTLWICKINAGGTIGSTAVTFKPVTLSAWRAEYTTYSSFVASGGTTIPFDDTIPQVTEGSQLMSLTFTPISDTLEIESCVPMAFGTNDGRGTLAIFKDGASNAIAASAGFVANSYLVCTPISCERRITVTPGVQVVITVRVGPHSGTGTLYVNGNSANREYGGVMGAWLKVREVNAGA